MPDSFIDDMKVKPKIAPICEMAHMKTLTCIVDALVNDLYGVKAQWEQIK